MGNEVKRYDLSGFGSGMVERADGAWYRVEDYDALRAENERLQAENERMKRSAQTNWNEFAEGAGEAAKLRAELEALRLQLEAAWGLLERVHDGLEKGHPLLKVGDEIRVFLTATPAPEVRCQTCDGTGDVHRADGEWLGECHCAKAEQGERQEAVAWKVVGVHPKHRHPHVKVEHTIKLAEGQAAHWRNRGCEVEIIPLYTTPQPGQDVSGRPVVLATLYRDADGNPGCRFVGDPEMRIRDGDALMAVTQHDQQVRGLVEALEWYADCGRSGNRARAALARHRNPATVKRCPTCTGTCAEICKEARP